MTTIAELVEAAYLAGYRHGVTSFAFWKGGQQFCGNSSHIRLADVLREAPTDCREGYESFLRGQQVRHDGDERPIRALGDDDGLI
jgi:hypothetical protein